MSAHHGPPCGHTVLGTCAGCGGPLYDPAATARIEARVRHYGRMIKVTPDPMLRRDEIRLEHAPCCTLAVDGFACKCGAGAQVIAPMHHESCPSHGPATSAPAAGPAAAMTPGPNEFRIDAAELTLTTGETCAFGPVTVTAETMAEAQRKIGALNRLREKNEEAVRRSFVELFKFKYEPEAVDHIEARVRYHSTTIKGGSYGLASGIALDPDHKPKPVDPLDVEYDGVTLRGLLNRDEAMRCEDVWARQLPTPGRGFTPAQRAAVSAHWSAQLRAKVAASAAADKARETSVVVDPEDR